MLLIAKNRVNTIKSLLQSFTEVTYRTLETQYEPNHVVGPLDVTTQRHVLEDIQEGQAKLYHNTKDDTYILTLAGHCTWVLK